MAKKSNQKAKILYLRKILLEQTDDDHGMTMPQIIAALQEYGIEAERKSVYADIEALNQMGMDIQMERQGKSSYYFVGAREFEFPEVKLLVDLVQSSKFITQKKSQSLIKKIEQFTSEKMATKLNRQVYVQGRVKTDNEKVYYNIDMIHTAINENRKIEFEYMQWNLKRKLVPKGDAAYETSPVAVVVDNQNYYLVAYDVLLDGTEKYYHYRIDKMQNIKMLEEPRKEGASKRLDMAKYEKSVFGMFGGAEEIVRLEVDNGLVGVMIDRFGTDVVPRPKDDNTFEIRVPVALSPQFYGWIISLGKGVKVVHPPKAVEGISQLLKEVTDRYSE